MVVENKQNLQSEFLAKNVKDSPNKRAITDSSNGKDNKTPSYFNSKRGKNVGCFLCCLKFGASSNKMAKAV